MNFADNLTDNIEYVSKVFFLAFAISFMSSPLSIKLAKKIGAIDTPKDNRRMHTKSIPRFGGIAIFLGSMVSIYYFVWNQPNIRIAMIGGLLIYLLGAIDDLKNLPASIKFLYQMAVAIMMYAFGLRIEFITNYFGSGLWGLNEALCFIVTVLWIVGITNTINLIDGLDGLAAGVSCIVSLAIAYIAYIHGNVFGVSIVYIALTALAGACAGFLPYNFSPAKTFMGDGGALYLGFMIAIMSVISPLKQATIISIIVPVIALAIPIFDTFSAIVRRALRHQPIMSPDKEHLHHKLIASGYDQKRSVVMLYGITALMGLAAILISRGLYKDSFVIFAIVASYLYIFATDSANRKGKFKKEIYAEKFKRYFANLYTEGWESLEIKLKNDLNNENKRFIITANPETFMSGLHNSDFNKILAGNDVTIVPDGIGIVKGAELLGIKCKDKITGVDLASWLLSEAHKTGKSVYLFGAKEEVLEALVNKINSSYKGIKIVGTDNGYAEDKDAIFDKISNLNPDIILVALGIPAQEMLINKHFSKFDKGIFVGVGGSFDVLSGTKKRAPKFFVNNNLEWLYRIVKEPARLKRFYKGNIKFFHLIRKINELL